MTASVYNECGESELIKKIPCGKVQYQSTYNTKRRIKVDNSYQKLIKNVKKKGRVRHQPDSHL